MAPEATTVPEIAGAALGSGTSKITKTPGPSAAVLYIDINFPPAASMRFLAASYRLVLGFSMMLLRDFGVYCPVIQKCMVTSSSRGMFEIKSLLRAQQERAAKAALSERP